MTPRLVPALIFALAALPALAETYKWIDDKGRVNYSNAPPPQAAGKAQAVEDRISVMGMDPAVRAWADRHFAQKAYADEQDWQRRQQAMAQQSYYMQPGGSYGSSYGSTYPYYGGYFYGTSVRRPILTRAIIKNNTSPRFPTHHRSR